MPRLVLPDAAFHRSYLAALAEDPGVATTHLPAAAELVAPAAFARYVAGLAADREPAAVRPTGHVPQTVLWWVEDGEFLTRVSVRHRLNRRLRTWGGHVGYWTRPSARRQGHANGAFRAALGVAHGLGLDPVLVTCDHDNHASRRVIEAGGGAFEQCVGEKRLYWVPTRPWVAPAGPTAAGPPVRPV